MLAYKGLCGPGERTLRCLTRRERGSQTCGSRSNESAVGTDQSGVSRSLEGRGSSGQEKTGPLAKGRDQGESQDRPPGPLIPSRCSQAQASSAVWQVKKKLRLAQACPQPRLVLSGVTVQAWPPRPFVSTELPVREALTGGSMERGGCEEVTGHRVVGSWAGAPQGVLAVGGRDLGRL